MKMQRTNSTVMDLVPTEDAQIGFNAPAFEWDSQSDTDRTALRYEEITRLKLDYRIALVPLTAQQHMSTRQELTARTADVLMLPYTWKEFVTHVRREVGNSSAAAQTHILVFADVSIDLLSMEVLRAGDPVILTTMEFKVLKFFVMNPNRVVSRDELLNQVWGYDNYPCTRTVDNHLMRLRQKLEPDAANPTHFRTVHGIGYKFVPEPRVR
jgi:DNA-binding response OmpR family regulator